MSTMTTGRMPMKAHYKYRKLVNNTKADLEDWFLQEIYWAMNNDGKFNEDLEDIFTLTLADNGNWVLDWV